MIDTLRKFSAFERFKWNLGIAFYVCACFILFWQYPTNRTRVEVQYKQHHWIHRLNYAFQSVENRFEFYQFDVRKKYTVVVLCFTRTKKSVYSRTHIIPKMAKLSNLNISWIFFGMFGYRIKWLSVNVVMLLFLLLLTYYTNLTDGFLWKFPFLSTQSI